MSCYNNKGNYNYFASRTSSGYKYLGFIDTVTQPETVVALTRAFLSEGTNSVKRRAFQMFILLNDHCSSKPDVTSGVFKEYSLISNTIFEPFIDGYGKYNPSVNYNRECNIIRLKVSQYLKRLTGCGDVNIIFKTHSATPTTCEIDTYINDLAVSQKDLFNFSIDNKGIQLKNTATVTLMIPLRFIDNTITAAYGKAMQYFNQNGIKVSSTDEKLITAIKNNISDIVSVKLYKSLLCALYKEQIFNKFAQDTMIVIDDFSKIKDIDSVRNYQIKMDSKNTTPSLNLREISNAFSKISINEINPHMMLDMFEIFNSEINLFMRNFVRDEKNSILFAPDYANLQSDHEDFVDEESRMCSSVIYLTKLNYCIIAAMLLTKNSIKESSRSYYVNMVQNGMASVRSLSKSTYITNNKVNLLKELDCQLDTISFLADDIIKLKKFSYSFTA